MDSIETVIEKWNAYSKVYSEESEYGTLQSAVVLQNLSCSRFADRIIDAGCGPGLSALSFCSTAMKKGAKIYSVDISDEMLDIFKTRFELSDFSKNPDNCIRFIENSEVDSHEKICALENDGRIGQNGKGVYLLECNIEYLPFPDDSFDAYTANLSLQLTPNHTQMLKECYRLLKPGCKAAFAVWGKEVNTSFVTFMPEILEKYGVTQKPEKYCNFHLNDIDKLTEDAKSVGFTSVKAFYMPSTVSR